MLGIIIGVAFGGFVGVCTMCLMIVSSKADRQLDVLSMNCADKK